MRGKFRLILVVLVIGIISYLISDYLSGSKAKHSVGIIGGADGPTQIFVTNNNPKTEGQPESRDLAKSREEFFDFAVKYRLDYIPLFTEGNAPADSREYLYYAFAINLANWGDDKGTMTREYVEEVINAHFPVGEIKHVSWPQNWNYDGARYTAVPAGLDNEPLNYLIASDTYVENGKKIYKASFNSYIYEDMLLPEDLVRFRNNIINDDLSGLKLLRTEEIRYYWNETTNMPVFISHTAASLKPSPAYDPAAYLTDEEMVTAGGVRLTMSYEEVLSIIDEPDEAYDNMPGVKSLLKDGYHYGFYQIGASFPEDYSLPHDDKYYLLSISAREGCTDPLPRNILIGDDIEQVFDKFPTEDRTLRKWAMQTVYGKQEPGQPRSFLEFTTVLDTYRIWVTTTTQVLNIHFDKQNKVRNIELLWEKS
ncbi:MAG: hypothetical protein PHF24_02945 [Syntrophomonas sp.]|nr:hypothetical protein [Syntrophomonas sp.]